MTIAYTNSYRNSFFSSFQLKNCERLLGQIKYCALSGEPEVISSVTLAYMRHVILKFLTSPEVESKQMTRALATILQFTKEEELRLQAYLDWKMSWFAGPKPKLLH